ncbi:MULTISPECIES: hypothetical protein [Saccharibacillus]|uniref:hypothetical protein n=1 Tax=Saccharibacillus TaxID=456492 RepID=UPI00123A619A|nr:hypothetical protein [Saccharibacillus sp. WB 17]MWJ30854.1 hypothetical protein [Saccharibacillus sp. WB 17]
MWLSAEMKLEMRQAFERGRDTIGRFPAPYAEAGIRYLDRFDPERGGGATNYICCLLPFWLRQASGASLGTCRSVAEANVFGMLHFHLQDERIDRAAGTDRLHVALSQLFNAEMNARYAALFSSPADFGHALRLCTAEWAAGLNAERSSDPFFGRTEEIAARAAPLLLGPYALFGSDEPMRERALYAVRQSLITLQMADDWADYAEDLRENAYNCLVSLYRREQGLDPEDPVAASDINDAVYARGLLGTYARFAAERQLDLETYAGDFPGLIGFHAALAGDLEQIAARIEAEKRHLQLGGLNYWLLGQKNL